jgi:hypothetical protein
MKKKSPANTMNRSGWAETSGAWSGFDAWDAGDGFMVAGNSRFIHTFRLTPHISVDDGCYE